ncbi:uncharacterized protein LOC110023503 [Phalaenopsis equestris]|uniref:uncharacterized protein LOC110023503 n=1 Tax=Phalaenopsis equestris TaxID=78828 RepID=UPI0009E27C6E|nr:uncharacterized protein LOC110023503 [Phalaenopsis equestris]
MAMDWYSWLSKSSMLDQSLVCEYSLILSQNELEEEDIIHFDHQLLLSMGISVAKHRLQILKLAKEHRRHRRRRRQPPRPLVALLTAVHKTRDCLARYVHNLVHHESKAVVVVPRLVGGERRQTVKKRRLLITDAVCSGVKALQLGKSSPASQNPLVLLASKEEKWAGYKNKEQMRWDAMFQDLKPT